MNLDLPDLATSYGETAVRQLATAYEAAILAVSRGDLSRMPDRDTRLAMLEAILHRARERGFDAGELASEGIAAAALEAA